MASDILTAAFFGTAIEFALWGVCATFAYKGFVEYNGNPEQAAISFSPNVPHPVLVAMANVLFFTMISSADTIVAWRVYIIWSRSPRILVVLCVALICGMLFGISIVAVNILACINGWRNSYVIVYRQLFLAACVFFLCMNIFCTGMVIGRLLWVGRRVSDAVGKPGLQRYGHVVRALVESGALYSLAMGAYVICWATGKNPHTGHNPSASFIIWFLPSIVGLAPTLIVLQLHLGYHQPADVVLYATESDVEFSHPDRTFSQMGSHASDRPNHRITSISSSRCSCGKCICGSSRTKVRVSQRPSGGCSGQKGRSSVSWAMDDLDLDDDDKDSYMNDPAITGQSLRGQVDDFKFHNTELGPDDDRVAVPVLAHTS
ncbi:hypothetical protein FRB97_008174 [Tulasnella sp. 331]|nr:hypothetical protein FRB97_008174 [Tulasnella sp. 331]KAG8881027.1 hypothetical protein FRB98_004593 [Tulasnella sp. 332]